MKFNTFERAFPKWRRFASPYDGINRAEDYIEWLRGQPGMIIEDDCPASAAVVVVDPQGEVFIMRNLDILERAMKMSGFSPIAVRSYLRQARQRECPIGLQPPVS